MGDTWDVGSRPVSALLRGQLQLDELVTPHPGLDSASICGHATQQQPPQQATWQLHWDRVQGPVGAASTQSTRVRKQPSAIGRDSASASGAGVAAAADPQGDAATSSGSSPVGASGQAPDASDVQQCSSTATSAEDAAQEGQIDAAQPQGLHSAGKETAGGTACAGPEPVSLQQPAEASPGLTADDEDYADDYQEQPEEGVQDGDKALQQDEPPYGPSQPCGDADQGASTPSQQQQQQQQQEEEQQQQEHAIDAQRAGEQEQACSRALSALRDSYGRAEAGAAWPLDYARLREHLQEVSTDPAKVVQLLQALHWRLCATPGGLQRFDLITDWVQKDLLLLLRKPPQLATSYSSSAAAGGTLGTSCVEQPSTSSSSGSMAGASSEVEGPRSLPEQVMASGSAACQLRLLRLLRAASCSRGGRAYLLQPHGRVLRTLLQQLRDPQAVTRALQQHYRQQPGSPGAASQQQDCVEVEMLVLVVSTLQKLALKRRAQSPLIRAGLVPWLVSLLAGDTLTKVDPECPAPVPAPAAGTAGGVSQSSGSAAAATSNAAPSSSSNVPQQPATAVAAGSSRTAEEADPDEQQDDDGQEDTNEACDAEQSEEQLDQPQQPQTAAARALAAAAAAAATLGEEDTELPEATSPPAADADANANAASAAAAAADTAADTAAGSLTSSAVAAAAAAAPTAAAAAPLPQSLQAAHPQDLPAPLLHSATALLLQLVLRSTGAAAAAEPSVAARLLDVAAVLLGTSEAQVHAYTNATLYALFSNASVCCLAVTKGLDKHLQQLLQQAPGASMQRQLQHVLARLQKRCPAADNAESPSSAAAGSHKRVQGGKGAGGTDVESDDEARQDDDEDEPCEDLADLEQQLAADVQRGIQEAGISCTGASEAAAAAAAAADQMLLGEQLLEASYPQLPDDPTITCVSPTATGQLSPTHPMMSSWGSWRPGGMLGAGAGGAAGGGGWPGAGGVGGGWSLPPAQWGTGTHVLQMSGSWGTGAWDASIPGSSVGMGAGIAGQLHRGVYAAAQQTQHTLQHLQQGMTFTAPKVSVAPAGPHMMGLGAAGGGVRQSLSATSPVPATSPTPMSRTVHW